MRKQIKDITLEELHKICVKAKNCTVCKINKGCNFVGTKLFYKYKNKEIKL